MIKVSVVILNWNGADMLRRFLPSVISCSQGEGIEVCVADNGSSDDSCRIVEGEFPSVRLIRLPENYGFAEGYNKALEQVDAEYVVLLNSDVKVSSGWLSVMVSYMDLHPEVPFEGGVFDVLDFLGENYFLQGGFTFSHSVYDVRESVSRDEVRHINAKFSVGIGTGFPSVHLDVCIRNVQYFQVGKFITQMSEVLGIYFTGQSEVGDTVGLILRHHGNQRSGFTYKISLAHLGDCS